MTLKEIKTVLERHKHWIAQDCYGLERMRADLRDASLSGVNLRYADLRYASLSGADLSDADLSDANLRDASLSGANLRYASLSGADLSGADLRDASLSGANLRYASLRDADLSGADLCYASLSGADLSGANLRDADLRYASLSGAKNVPFVPTTCPDTGSFIAYKKALGDHIIKLEIPEDAKRSSSTGRKCRCNKAKVLEIQKTDGSIAEITSVPSNYDMHFIYRVGEIVSVDDFDEDRWKECSSGIHFFINRQEAVEYDFL